MSSPNFASVRPSPIAGSWYPGSPSSLRSEIESFLAQAPELNLKGPVKGLIVPHAGYIYSGYTAACAFKALTEAYNTVVVLSPLHAATVYPLLTTAYDAYQTPLGKVPIRKEALKTITENLSQYGLSLMGLQRDREHSLEIELPFLQVCLPDGFRLVPVMMSRQSLTDSEALSLALTAWLKNAQADEHILIVASSDQSHFYDAETADAMDQRMIEAIQAGDVARLYQLEASGQGEACGLGPIATLLLTLQQLGKPQVTITDHRNSSAVTGDRSNVVGYTSAVITL